MKLTLDHTQRLNLHALLGAQWADVGSQGLEPATVDTVGFPRLKRTPNSCALRVRDLDLLGYGRLNGPGKGDLGDRSFLSISAKTKIFRP